MAIKRVNNETCYYVYLYIRLDTCEPFYVGKGKKNRCYELNKNRNKYFKNIVNSTEVAVCILNDGLTEEQAFGIEIYYIYLYIDIYGEDLVNMTDGGDGCSITKHKPETIEKMRANTSARRPEVIEKNRKAHLGKKPSFETIEKMSKNNGNKRIDVRLKRSSNWRGEKNPNYGKNLPEGTRKKLSTANDIPVILLNNYEPYLSSKEASEETGIHHGNIATCCTNKTNRKTAGKINGEKAKWMHLDKFLVNAFIEKIKIKKSDLKEILLKIIKKKITFKSQYLNTFITNYLDCKDMLFNMNEYEKDKQIKILKLEEKRKRKEELKNALANDEIINSQCIYL